MYKINTIVLYLIMLITDVCLVVNLEHVIHGIQLNCSTFLIHIAKCIFYILYLFKILNYLALHLYSLFTYI
jgi:hypothetical protein